ncbi:hypothetical protein L1987_45354 [Smallanthus sonchifolius]|uniref:Uncharacterized protein n=1 Tax=Smallanthus sonchifolius TaxID=185202 RepID=A0ACB9GRF1_9ASTR|nr:hypothetical protein L1987_45354 [Smallanthus sonchifolius]
MNVQNLVFLRDDCTATLKTHGSLLVMPKKLFHFGASRTEEIGEWFCETVNEPTALHQTMGIVRSLPAGVVFANALLLTTPLEALAETCEADQSIFSMNMPLLLLVALTGATVGASPDQRCSETASKDRIICTSVKLCSPDNEVVVDPRKQELISHLKNGKNFLRNQYPERAFSEFKIALELAQNLKDPIEEKKAARGLGASLQRQGKHKEAIKYHSMVLSISEREGEDSGNTEAFGAIADCYTELGDLEKAATFYDQYIARLQAD